MSLIELSHVIEGTLGPLHTSGAPTAGTNKVQTLTLGGTPTGGTFKLSFDGYPTAPITWSSNTTTLINNIDAALEALPPIGTGAITVAAGTLTAGIGTILLTSGGPLARLAHNTFTIAGNSLTGTSPTLAILETTPGVSATYRGAAKGALLTDTQNGALYVNSGTPASPNWTAQT